MIVMHLTEVANFLRDRGKRNHDTNHAHYLVHFCIKLFNGVTMHSQRIHIKKLIERVLDINTVLLNCVKRKG